MRTAKRPTPEQIADAAGRAAFGSPLVTNVLRGLVVEAIVDAALAPEWKWCSADWASWDFERGHERLEIRQAAAIQSWGGQPRREHEIGFDIRPRSGRWEEKRWIPEPGRAATRYVFAYHGEGDAEFADHRDPAQWEFFPVATLALPQKWRITLPAVRRLAAPIRFDGLREALL